MRDLDLESLEEHKPPRTITIPDGINIKLDFFKRYKEDKKTVILSKNPGLSELEKMFTDPNTKIYGWKKD